MPIATAATSDHPDIAVERWEVDGGRVYAHS
jgi:hypothetical protein